MPTPSENPAPAACGESDELVKALDPRAIFEALVDISPIAILISDLSGCILYASQAALRQHGAKRIEDLLGKSTIDMIAPEDRLRAVENLKKTLTEGSVEHIEYQVIRGDGSRHAGDLSAAVVKDLRGKPAAFIGFLRDLTDVRQSEELFQTIFNIAPVGIGIANAKGEVIAINDAMRKMMGYSLQELSKITVPDTYVHPEDVLKIRSQMNETGEIKEFLIHLKRKGGERYWANFSSKRIAIGGVTHYLTVQMDVSESQKTHEEMLRVSEMKTNIITFASHELKTPLIPILGWAELISKAKKNGEDLNKLLQAEDIDSIVRSANRLSTIISDFLDVGRIGVQRLDLNYSHLNLKALAEDAFRSVTHLAKNQNILIHNEIPSLELTADSVRLEQVLINLLSNAVKYSPPESEVWLRAREDDKSITILVKDQGFGFTSEELLEAFQPFSKAFSKVRGEGHIAGTGVGLYICKGIVEKHGGRIKIESEGAGKGSQVSFTLPKQPPAHSDKLRN